MSTGRDRRLHARASCPVSVIFEDEFGAPFFSLNARDISEGGVSLETKIFPARLGSFLFLRFTLPEQKRTIRTTGEVVRRPQARGGGLGIRFVGLKEEEIEAINRYVQDAPQVATAFPSNPQSPNASRSKI